VVEKIPEDKLSLDSVNGWFKRFGTVTNVAIDARSAKALVTFGEHDEAHRAWKSEDAVFNNRFVKLFWHRPMEGHGQGGARALAASANLVANINAKEAIPAPSTSTTQPAALTVPTPPAPAAKRKSATLSVTASALAAKQQLLEQQIAEQKSLMTQLTSASAGEKKEIMARLRKLGEEMKPSPSPAATPAPSLSLASTIQRRASSNPQADEQERKERERLDKELEYHSTTNQTDSGKEENTEDLKAKLARLKAEVCV
jgi:RNA-binding protein 26